MGKKQKKKAREKLAGQNGAGKRKKEGRETAPALPSFLPFYFRVCAFSIQRTRLSRNLEQASIAEFYISTFHFC